MINKHFFTNRFPDLDQSQSKQLLFLVLLIILLPVTVFLATNKTIKTFLLRIKGAANSRMYLLPEGVSQTPSGKWVFNKDQEVTMDIMLDSADNQIEGAESIINYNPAVISISKVECNQNYLLKNALVQSIAKNTDGTEAGKVDVACTAIPLPPYPDPNTLPVYQPMPANSQQAFAKIYFKALAATTASSAFTFQFAANNPDLSNAVLYQGSGTNVLGSVVDFAFDVATPITQISLSLSPSNGTYEVNKQFPVQIILNTANTSIDSVDVVIDYDKTNLRADLITPGNIFPSYSLSPATTGIDSTNGIIQVSGRVNAGQAQMVLGNNLLFATLTFTPLNAVNSANAGYIRFRYAAGDRNDSNVVTLGNDVLAGVGNGQYILTTVVQPTATPGGTTPTPTGPTPTINPNTPTPTIPPNTPIFSCKIKFRAVSTDIGQQLIKLIVRNEMNNFNREFLNIPVIYDSVTGGYKTSSDYPLVNVPAGSGYKIYVKGPKHLAKGFKNITLTANTTNTFDWTSSELEPGDLPPQDGVINSQDISRLIELLGNLYPNQSQLDTGDLNYDGAINGADTNELILTLSTKYDESQY